MTAADLSDPSAYERELRRLAAGSRQRYESLRREVRRSVRKGEPVTDPAAAPLAIAAARRVQLQRTWTWSVIVPALVLAILGIAIGGFAFYWYVLTVVPALLTEPWRARRRRNRALSAEAANLAPTI